MIQANV